jgi:hypothetical protein
MKNTYVYTVRSKKNARKCLLFEFNITIIYNEGPYRHSNKIIFSKTNKAVEFGFSCCKITNAINMILHNFCSLLYYSLKIFSLTTKSIVYYLPEYESDK